MKVNKYLSSILRNSTPLAMLPEAMDKFVKIISSAESFDSIEALKEVSNSYENDYFQVIDGVAIIPIKGAIFGESNCASMLGMGVANTDIQAALQLATEDPGVRSIILDINSPGGEVAGTADTANLVKHIATKKPVYAYVSDMAASAAYWIAANASKIIISETASLGSIGVRAVIEQEIEENVKTYTYLSSQSPKKDFDPNNSEHVADLQSSLDFLASIFINSVAAGRKTSFENVINNFGQGSMYYGTQAISRGMADEIGTLSGLIKRFSFSTGGIMSTEQDSNKILESERARVSGLLALPVTSETEKQIVEAGIKEGLSVESVALKILSAQKEKNNAILKARETDASSIPVIKQEEPAPEKNSEAAAIERIAARVNQYNLNGGIR